MNVLRLLIVTFASAGFGLGSWTYDISVAQAQEADAAPQEESVTDRLWGDYLAEDDALVTEWAELAPEERTVTAELLHRAERDQLIRRLLIKALRTDGARPNEAALWWLKLNTRLKEIDQDNLTWLKAQLEEIGWFTISGYGEEAHRAAFLIVQHGVGDRAFQKEILARFEELLPKEDIIPRHYALLFDRIHVFETGMQRYGTQLSCTADGTYEAAGLKTPETVDDRRAELGLPPLEVQIQQTLEATGPCSS